VLVIVSVSLALFAIAIAATAKVTGIVVARLGLDATTVLLWLGLAEWSNEARTTPRHSRRWSARPRRRSPHRRLERSIGPRRRASGTPAR
jgi:hypothetical protein